jgi:PAS domain S-box-containing protein
MKGIMTDPHDHHPSPHEEEQRLALERKSAEVTELRQALKQAEDSYRVLVENANDAIFVLQDGKVKFANPKALALGGVPAEDLDKIPFTEYLHPEEREIILQRHEQRLKGEKILNMYPLRIITRRGDTFWAEVNAVRIEWEGQPATLNIIRDITSQKIIEQNYFQTESLVTLRTLSGGMAHSFNNLLMGIQGRVSLLHRSVGPDDPRRQHLLGIESCVDDAAKLTRQMLAFSQSGKYSVRPVNLNEVAEEVARTFIRSQKQIQLIREYQTGLWTVEADRQQMEQVVMNLLLNAWQAIPEQGQVTVKTENFELTQGREQFKHVRSGRCVRLTVRDTGVGMDSTVRKRIFEPFFTTKGIFNHRGLGLSSTYGIIANHNGFIDVESTPGSGTTIAVYLPAIPES